MNAGFELAKAASGFVGQRIERLDVHALLRGRAIPAIPSA
jgi:hypothetical protein